GDVRGLCTCKFLYCAPPLSVSPRSPVMASNLPPTANVAEVRMVVDSFKSLSRNLAAMESGAAYNTGAECGSASTQPCPGSKCDGLVAQTTVLPSGWAPAVISCSLVSKISVRRFLTS